MAITSTGQYFHQEEDHFFLKFQSHGDVPRVFRVLIAEGSVKNGILEESLNGLVIYDLGSEDFDGGAHILQWGFNGDPDGARKAFEKLKTADWGWFLDFLRGQDAYQGNLEELVTIIEFERENEAKTRPGEKVELHENHKRALEAPEPGNLKTLIRVGAMSFDDEVDLRSEETRALDADPECRYSYPPIGREGAIAEIEARGLHHIGDRAYLGWFLDFSFEKDFSGKEGGYTDDIDPGLDQYWEGFVARDPEKLTREVEDDVFEGWTDNTYTTPPGDDSESYEFMDDKEHDFIVLTKIDYYDLAASKDRPMRLILDGLPDEALEKLLKVTRTLDQDINKQSTSADWHAKLNFRRVLVEQDKKQRDADAAPSGPMI